MFKHLEGTTEFIRAALAENKTNKLSVNLFTFGIYYPLSGGTRDVILIGGSHEIYASFYSPNVLILRLRMSRNEVVIQALRQVSFL